jgi:hypothetical protein
MRRVTVARRAVLVCLLLSSALLVTPSAQTAGAPALAWRDSPGGTLWYGTRLATDKDGNVYSSSATYSSGWDLVFQKRDREGTLLYSVSYGGQVNETAADIEVDADGNLYAVGSSNSPNFYLTAGSPNATNQQSHAFVMKLNQAGGIVYSYGIGDLSTVGIYGRAIALDAEGNAYIAYSRDDHRPTRRGGSSGDVILAVVNSSGTQHRPIRALVADDASYPAGLAVDASGRVFVAGYTLASTYPVTPDALDSTANLPPVGQPGKTWNGFFSIVDPDGTLAYSTYIGGTGLDDLVMAITVDGAGDVLLAGESASPDFPTTPGAFSTGGRRGGDVFIMKWTPAGTLKYSARFGSSEQDYFEGSRALAVDASGAAYLAVLTLGHDAPTTPDAFDVTFNGDADIFISRLSADGSALEWSSYLGTPYFEAADDILLDGGGFYLAGSSAGAELIPSSSPDDETYLNPPPPPGNEDEWPQPRPFLARFTWPANTPAGGAVTITAPGGGSSVSFSSVTAAGSTTMELIDATALNLTLPGGFAISGSSAAYEIRTTATVTGSIEVCLGASGLSGAEFASASILHGVAGAWQVETTRRDPATQRLCADVTSLSPFAVGVRTDVTAPQIACGAAASGWHGSNVTITCTASDNGSGLASSTDPSFVLGTSVTAGTETATASTGSRQVCDRVGNCATAGPIGGIKVDLRAPSVTIAAPGATRYILNAAVASSYACADAGSGIATCVGTVPSGAAIDTAAVGTRSFAVTATDRAGNTGAADVAYTVGYGVRPLYDPARAFRAGSTITLDFMLVDAAGRNVSSGGIAVSTRRLVRLQDGAAFDVVTPVPYLAKTGSYGGKVQTGGLQAGTYEVELSAGNDPAAIRLRFTLR